MHIVQHLKTVLLITLLAFTTSGVVNAKVASGLQNLVSELSQGKSVFNLLLHQGKAQSNYDNATGSSVVAKGGGTTTLYRAVGPNELADIQKTGQLINRGSAEGKYFTNSFKHASDYGKQAVKEFGDQPYTTIKTKVPTSSLPSPTSVDGGIGFPHM